MNRKQRRAQARAERRKKKVLPFARRVPASSIKVSDTVHHPPNPAWRPHLERLKAVFDEHDPKTVDEWELGFRKDRFPEREIAIWLVMADALEKAKSRRRFTRAERADLYDMVVSLSVGTPPREIAATMKALRRDEAEDILRSLASRAPTST